MPAALPEQEYLCTRCGEPGDFLFPFCPYCGALSPVFLEAGDRAIEVPGIPSAKTRARLVKRLAAWFPRLDPMELDARLQRGLVRIIEGVGDEDAERLASALATLKVPARVAPADRSWRRILWNPGLIGAIAAAAISLFVGLAGKAALILAAIASVAVGAFLKSKALEPMMTSPPIRADAEEWRSLAARYAAVVTHLGTEDAHTLKTVITAAFAVLRRLSGSSLTAAAAGYEQGDLHDKVIASLGAAVGLAEEAISADSGEAKRIRNRLGDLREALTETSRWITAREGAEGNAGEAEADELAQIRARVDQTLMETGLSPHSGLHAPSAQERPQEKDHR
jgi:hypothetical protein